MGKVVTDLGLEKRENKQELKKHAAAIHCSNALSLLQRKISNALLYHAYKELMLKEEHEITVKQLCRLIGYQGNNHAVIKEAFKGLISTIIEWNLINDETGAENWTASSIIASVSLEGPLCYYAYSPRMKQLLHSPSMFGKIDLVIQSRFRSSYGLALYENCIRYRGLPHTKWFGIEIFKKLMGIPEGMYGIFRDFKRRVLDKAVDEVNMYSDLVIESECIREGRSVVKMRFKLKERKKKTRLGHPHPMAKHNDNTPDVVLREKLIGAFDLTDHQITKLLAAYDVPFIEDKMAVVEASRMYQEGRVHNRAGYLLSAIKNDYHLPKPLSTDLTKVEETKQALESIVLKRQVEEIRHSYDLYRETMIQQAICSLSTDKRNQFMAQFERFATPTMNAIVRLQRHKYSRENVITSPQIQALFRQFAQRELDILLISIEAFVGALEEEKRLAWQQLKSCDPDHPLLRCGEKVI